MSDDAKLRLLEEKVLRLEQQLRLINRSNQGLNVNPALNTLGQDTEINGDLDLTGILNSKTQGDFGTSHNGQVSIATDSNGSIEIGKVGRSAAGTPFIDFHSSQNSPDFDSRIQGTGGDGTTGNGVLNLIAYGGVMKNYQHIMSLGAGEIVALTEKAGIGWYDQMLVEDYDASWAKKRVAMNTARWDGQQITNHLSQTKGIGAYVYRTSAVSWANNAWSPVSFESIYWEEKPSWLASHWASGDPSKLTARAYGIYSINASIRFAANATGQRGVAIIKNGVSICTSYLQTTSAGTPQVHIATHWLMNVGDYIQVNVFQNSGAALNLEYLSNGINFSMVKVG